MSTPVHEFHLRIPIELKEKLDSEIAGTKRSLAREINDRLERTFDPDPALRIADALRPFLSKLKEDEREEAARMLISVIDLLAKKRRRVSAAKVPSP